MTTGWKRRKLDYLIFLINIWSSPYHGKSDYYFLENRRLLAYLHQSASQAILDWAKSVHLLPGVVTVLHTFGSKLNFNCHIHALYSLGGVDLKTGQFKNYEFIPAESIKSRFKTILLHKLRREFVSGKLVISPAMRQVWFKEFGTTIFFEVQNKLWAKEWYVYIGEKLDNATHTVAYVGRYAKRPCLSEAKIIAYDRDADIVSFRYQDKLAGEERILDFSVNDFIGSLIRHIPEKYFNMIRYYGMYANVVKEKVTAILAQRLIFLYGRVYLLFEPNIRTWRQRVVEATDLDPLVCPKCRREMTLIEIAYRIRDGTWKTKFIF